MCCLQNKPAAPSPPPEAADPPPRLQWSSSTGNCVHTVCAGESLSVTANVRHSKLMSSHSSCIPGVSSRVAGSLSAAPPLLLGQLKTGTAPASAVLQKYGVSVSSIVSSNPQITNPDFIQPGKQLTKSTTHLVSRSNVDLRRFVRKAICCSSSASGVVLCHAGDRIKVC